LTVPVEQGSVVARVIDRVREALLRKELKPGDYLPPEGELSKNLRVGKSSVREAVKMLQAMGVVEVRRGRGTLIRTHPGADYINPMIFQLLMESGYPDDLVELRMMFEPALCAMAMERATDEDLERIRKAVEKLEAAVHAGTQSAQDDLAFHLAILHATRNPLVIRIGETIFQLFTPSITTSMQQIPERAVRDHRRIFEALCRRDERQLREAVVQSYGGWKQSLYKEERTGGVSRKTAPHPGVRRTPDPAVGPVGRRGGSFTNKEDGA
jgi:GntR family transcriptional regulator, transcriptional repressor for pyruvate dehydrogenase complex